MRGKKDEILYRQNYKRIQRIKWLTPLKANDLNNEIRFFYYRFGSIKMGTREPTCEWVFMNNAAWTNFSEIKQIRSALLMIISWRWHFVWECSLLFALFNLIIHHHKCRPDCFLVITNFIVAIFILREKDAVYVTKSVGIIIFILMNCDNIIMLFILI